MSLFKRLFGGNSAPDPEPERHEGFEIYPEPMPEDGKFRLAARIEKEVDGARKSHRLIRADMFDSREAAAQAAVLKAKVLIDERGEAVFKV